MSEKLRKLLDNENVSLSDKEAWLRHPKINWMYDTSRLLESQKVDWTPFKTDISENSLLSNYIDKDFSVEKVTKKDKTEPGKIYTNDITLPTKTIDVAIRKGKLKWLNDRNGDKISGDTELKINSLCMLHLQRYFGFASIELDKNNKILNISFKFNKNCVPESYLEDEDLLTLLDKIYNKRLI